MKVVNHEYERMRWNDKTDLGNHALVVPVEVGTRELGPDEEPEPMHRCSERDVQRVCLACSTGEQCNKPSKCVDNDTSGVTSPRKGPRFLAVGMDRCLNGIDIACREVAANVRKKSR